MIKKWWLFSHNQLKHGAVSGEKSWLITNYKIISAVHDTKSLYMVAWKVQG